MKNFEESPAGVPLHIQLFGIFEKELGMPNDDLAIYYEGVPPLLPKQITQIVFNMLRNIPEEDISVFSLEEWLSRAEALASDLLFAQSISHLKRFSQYEICSCLNVRVIDFFQPIIALAFKRQAQQVLNDCLFASPLEKYCATRVAEYDASDGNTVSPATKNLAFLPTERKN